MSDLGMALTVSGSVFGVIMASQYGRRDYSWHKKVLPLVSVAVFAWFYLRHAPTASVDVAVYAVGAVIGVVFGLWAALATKVERDPRTGRMVTVSGLSFMFAFLTGVALRVLFVAFAEHVTWFRDPLGRFMSAHQITVAAIPPFFVLMATVMVATRVALVWRRAAAVGRRGAVAPEPRGVRATA